MPDGRAPRSRFYDGGPYARVLDPLLANLHGFVAKQIEPGLRVLGAGCGTGSLALMLAEHATEVVGVELSPAMVEHASRRVEALGADHVRFVGGDLAVALADEPDGAFDVATLVMSLHEMPSDARAPVLQELARLAGRVLVLDYRAPMPWNLAGIRNRLIEVSAGPEHFGAFLDFGRRGGTAAIADEVGLVHELVRYVDAGALALTQVTRAR